MMQPEESQQQSLKVRLLGTGEFQLGETLRFSYTKVQALLLLLLLEKTALSRERLTYMLWPNQDATQARSNLRNALHLLRRVVGKSRVGGNLQFVTWHQQADDWLDVDELCQAPSAQQLELLSTYSGEILSDFVVPDAPSYMDWLDTKRMHYQGAVMACTDRLYEQALSQQLIDMRVSVAKTQVRIDPWNEEFQQRLITSLAESGDIHGAMAQWDQACSLFQRELDIQLSPNSQSLLREIQMNKSREPLNVINARGGGSISIEELAATPMQTAALLQIDCYAKDPHNTEAIHSLQMLRMAIERCVLANDGLMAWRNGAVA
jgi:DNA-binding SARP family transcriptional activator